MHCWEYPAENPPQKRVQDICVDRDGFCFYTPCCCESIWFCMSVFIALILISTFKAVHTYNDNYIENFNYNNISGHTDQRFYKPVLMEMN